MSYDIRSDDYAHRVYAGVLGKMIGVYLGRPIEGWLYRDILKSLGPINYYVSPWGSKEWVVTDDDLTGTFTFIRALEDNLASGRNLTAKQIGQTWLNYIIENKTILWWGGVGLSTEHTAFLHLKSGIAAPESGSIARNSKVVAEQIGSQIFIDGWAIVAPGDPELAAEFARKAASVSHDGEAIYGAQVVAAMESLAFVEPRLDKLLDVATGLIPKDSLIFRLIADLRAFHARHPDDWERAMVEVLEKDYGYDKYGGNCHMIPNHGVIIMALLYCRDDFQRAQMIANTAGWDTDCNAGNVGCLMGIKNGLAGIEAGPDWRGPVADRLYLPTADGGSCMTDAVRESFRLINLGRALQGAPTLAPKAGARFHFSLPGSVQGFQADPSADATGTSRVFNEGGRLAVKFDKLAAGRVARAGTATFIPQTAGDPNQGYGFFATPTLYPGQTVRASVATSLSTGGLAAVALYVAYYGDGDKRERLYGPRLAVNGSAAQALEWKLPSTGGRPIAEVGVEIAGEAGASGLSVVDYLTWDGTPELVLGDTPTTGDMALRQWVHALDAFRRPYWGTVNHLKGIDGEQAFMAISNVGRGMAIHGTCDWADYVVSTTITPHLATAAGIAARVRGLRRYYALLLRHPNRAVLVKIADVEQALAEVPFDWAWNADPHQLALAVKGNQITGLIDGKKVFDVVDDTDPILSGAIAVVVADGRIGVKAVSVGPVPK